MLQVRSGAAEPGVLFSARTYAPRGVLGRVIESVGRRIVGGDLSAGTVLPPEAELARQMGVSRTALREAVKVLSAKGLVESRQRLGVRVRPAASWNLLDPDLLAWQAAEGLPHGTTTALIELRRVIEPVAARLAASRRAADELTAIEAAFAAMATAVDDHAAYLRADIAFHEALFAACGNPFIARLGGVVGQLLSVSFIVQRRSLLSVSVGLALHEGVLIAIRDGDPAAAERAMLEIIDQAQLELERVTARTATS